MKKLTPKHSVEIETVDDQWHELKIESIQLRLNEIRENKIIIIENALIAERELSSLIKFYFFGHDEANVKRSANFINLILETSWCSFSAKIQLATYILTDLKVLTKPQIDAFQKLLRKVMSYRNAFTHGKIIFFGDETKLTWFEGGTKTRILDDEYLAKVDADLVNCISEIRKVVIKTGALVMVPNLDNPLTAGQGAIFQVQKKRMPETEK